MALHLETFSDYLVLDPKKTKISELVRLLYSGNIGKIDSIGCPDGAVVHETGRRRLIFLSIVLQKFFLSAKPGTGVLAKAAFALNLLEDNGGLCKLVRNFFTRNVVIPDINSKNFISLFAFIDEREELDENIKAGDGRYNAALSIMAAKIAYENEARIRSIVTDRWNMEFLDFYNCWEDFQDTYCTQAFMISDKPAESGNAELVVVAFRGTDDSYDACTDVDFSFYDLPGVGKIHGGFMKALGLQKNGWPKEIETNPQTPFAYYVIREKLREVLKRNPDARLLVTGHSLGAALAAIFPIILKYHGEDSILDRLEGVYTFGQPRVGDRGLCEFVEKFLDSPKKRYFRFVYSNDIVTRVPFDDNTLLFKHFGKCLYYDSTYSGKEMIEEPNKNYFSLIDFLPKHLNAAWELARSFAISRIYGEQYEESSVMRVMRIMGLIVPGIAAHCTQDYVNVTRVGTPAIIDKISTNKSE